MKLNCVVIVLAVIVVMFIDEIVDFAVSVVYDDEVTTVANISHNASSNNASPNNDSTDTGETSIISFIN